MGKVTVIVSGKGGTGKTTVTSGLGTALARRGHKVLLIDCDFGIRGLDLMLGVDGEIVFDISDIVNGNCPPASAIYACREVSGLYILPASQGGENEVNLSVMCELVKVLSKDYDNILIDSQAGIGSGFETATAAAEQALLVSDTEPLSLRGCDKVRRRLQECGMKEIRLIINHFSERTFRERNDFEDLDAVIDKAGARLIGVIPADDKAISMLQKGQPVQGKLKAAEAFDRIAARLCGEDIPLLSELLK